MSTKKHKEEKYVHKTFVITNSLPCVCRKEETRTPDPHVPNVVRYQLRYFPNGIKTDAKVRIKHDKTRLKEEKSAFLVFFFDKNLRE